MGVIQSLSVGRKSLKYKIMIAFSLMSIIPLLVVVYFVTNYVFPYTKNMTQVSIIVLFTLWISWLGYLLIRQIINPVIDLAFETKIIAEGKYGSKVALSTEDELGDIAEAVNAMTGKIRCYIGELQDYSKKTAALNVRIHKKVITLTNLMRLGDLISTGTGFDEVISFAAEKIAEEVEQGFCAIFVKEKTGGFALKSFANNTGKEFSSAHLESTVISLERILMRDEHVMVDSRPLSKPWQKQLREKMGHVNALFFGMKSTNKMVGAMVMGNFSEDMEFEDEEIGVVRAFERELVLGFQSSQVFERIKSLEVVDSLTGLYTRVYLEDRLEDEINRAIFYQRPCSLILIKVDDFEKYSGHYGVPKAKHVLRQLAQLLGGVMSPVGKVARFEYDEFAMLLPEKNKRETIEVGEDIRKRIEAMELSSDPYDKITVSIGVGENPIDGTNAKEIIARAYYNMEKAKSLGANRVVGE